MNSGRLRRRTSAAVWTLALTTASAAIAALLAGGFQGPPGAPARADNVADLVDWGLERFARSGLPAPPFEEVATAEITDCDGRPGWATFDRDGASVYLCDDLEIRSVGFHCVEILAGEAKRCLLHELAHVWIEAHVDAHTRALFMAHSGAKAWDDPALPWHARGVEQAAETLAWGLACEPTTISNGTDSASVRRAAGFEILTGQLPAVDCAFRRLTIGLPR